MSARPRRGISLAHDETPERLFERQWCLTLLARVLEDVRDEYVADGKERLFERLRGFLTMEADTGSQAEAAHDLEMTIAAVKVAVHRLRKRYRDALREHVSAAVASPDEIEDERQYLLKTLARV